MLSILPEENDQSAISKEYKDKANSRVGLTRYGTSGHQDMVGTVGSWTLYDPSEEAGLLNSRGYLP